MTHLPLWLKNNRAYLLLIGIVLFGIAGWFLYHRSAHGPIRPYRVEDRASILRMMHDDWYWLVAENLTDFSAEYMLDHHAANQRYPDKSLSISVYEAPEGEPVGFVTYHKLDGMKGRIQFLAVDKQHRKHGYARKLLEHAIAHFEKQGLCAIDIAVRGINKPAKSLYEKLGFHESYRTPDGFLGMTKQLCARSNKSAQSAEPEYIW